MKTQAEIEKVLGEPVAIELPDYVRRIKNHLFLISLVSIALILGGLEIAPESLILGLKFKGLNNHLIFQGLFILNIYTFIHFLWCSVDRLQEWKLRITGTKVAFVTVARLGAEGADYPNNPRQSTLYNWWRSEAKQIGSLKNPLDQIDSKLKKYEKDIKKALKDNNPNIINVCQTINSILEEIATLKGSIQKTQEVFQSNRIPASLKRFDNAFYLFLRSQNLRWFLIEFLLPVLIGLYSLALLSINIFK